MPDEAHRCRPPSGAAPHLHPAYWGLSALPGGAAGGPNGALLVALLEQLAVPAGLDPLVVRLMCSAVEAYPPLALAPPASAPAPAFGCAGMLSSLCATSTYQPRLLGDKLILGL